MSINITNSNGITKSHTAARLQIELLAANEDVKQMRPEIYFAVDTLLNGEKVAETQWDGANPLILNCEGNPRLEEALKVIQEEIGLQRYAQLTAPVGGFPTPDPNPPSL